MSVVVTRCFVVLNTLRPTDCCLHFCRNFNTITFLLACWQICIFFRQIRIWYYICITLPKLKYFNVFDKIFSLKKISRSYGISSGIQPKILCLLLLSVYIGLHYIRIEYNHGHRRNQNFSLADPEAIHKLSFILETIHENHVKISGLTSS